ncbi:hypothetical protein NDS46_30330 (plasmid) [Paenibacillus thiaminolyticus]|uniref:hypothetical protein n=1 Tax=Paenibacillus thiaminolyticus TaxID=49283 RepID=UPI00232C16F6|nr:hypothetical protein [Paenibacillus thiaminolyticus]WCF11646.1 hypothetical protein NDS46_30330 [Paenibacillus thiaminolyticus]
MSELKNKIVKYLNDDDYYNLVTKDITMKRKFINYYCKRHNGEIVPLKELGDIFGIFDESPNDHPNHVMDVLIELSISFYGKKKYVSVLKKYSTAINNGILIYE